MQYEILVYVTSQKRELRNLGMISVNIRAQSDSNTINWPLKNSKK